MNNEKCGVYQIKCGPNGEAYIGSSVRIYSRWSEHRRKLRRGDHHCPRLQKAWDRYGESAFHFLIIQECAREVLEFTEQQWLNLLRPTFNVITDIAGRSSEEMLAKRAASLRARAALITHCPKGHAYDDANTMIHQGKRVCRKCNAERVSGIYAAETSEEREKRRVRAAIQAAREKDRAQRAAYAASHRAEKAEYDRQHRTEANERRRESRGNESPERREYRLRLKRESYERHREAALVKMRERYRLCASGRSILGAPRTVA